MPTFSNVHAELDNHELHPPRDFSLAENDTFLAKNPLGDIQWFDTYWQRPILGFADATLPPLTLTHGDRYILFRQSGSRPDTGTTIDYSVDFSIDTSVWVDTSMDGTAIDTSGEPNPDTPEPGDVHPAWGNAGIGDIVEYYRTNNKDQSVFDWRGVTPSAGYQVFNLADQSSYYFTGSRWVKHATGNVPGAAQIRGTYTELALLASQAKLIPGLRYFITDKDIILTAVSSTRFSIEGDYTFALPAHGFVELVAGEGGSINSIMVNGYRLLPMPVPFDTDLYRTATQVAEAIDNGSDIHGFGAISIGNRVYIAYVSPETETYNNANIHVLATDIEVELQAMAKGHNIGTRWFKVKYRFEEDWIAEMADSQGNVLSYEPAIVEQLGFNPYGSFPWAHSNVVNNTVSNSLFLAFPESGMVEGNTFLDGSIFMGNIKAGSSFSNNTIQYQSYLRLNLHQCQFTNNNMLVSSIDMGIVGGHVVGNTLSKCTMWGRNINNEMIGGNTIIDCILELGHATTELSLNNLTKCDCYLNSAQMDISNNCMQNTLLTASNAVFEMEENDWVDCEMNIAGAINYSVLRNKISKYSILQLSAAQGQLTGNNIDNVVIDGNNTHMDFSNNTIETYTHIDLTGYRGQEFRENQINGSDIELTNSGSNFNKNRVYYSNLQLNKHENQCVQNDFRNSNIFSNYSTAVIDNNYIDFSTVKLSNTNCVFSGNKATYYSTYDLDGFMGAGVIMCEVMKSSELLARGNTQEQGRIILDEITTLDISYENCIIYLSQFRFPYATIKLRTTQINATCTKQKSTIYHFVELAPDGTLNLDVEGDRYGGIYSLSNSGTLTAINGISTLPDEFIIAAVGSASINIDISSANISVANGISLGLLNGVSNHYVKMAQRQGGLVIIEAYTS